MKTKQAKEETDKTIDEEITLEPKTRARKKAEIANEEDKKTSVDEPKTSKDKKNVAKPKAVAKKRPLGIRKTLRNKKVVVIKDKLKNVIKQIGSKRGRKPAIKAVDNSVEKDTVPLIPASEIKKEPIEDNTPNSRSSSPKTAGRRPRLSSDMVMMKSMLSESPSSLVIGPRTSPYSMRSDRSNSPSLCDGKNLRSGKPRKVKNNLLNEVVMKEQKKRRRLLSDSKTLESSEAPEDTKKLKRGRSCSRDGSEISKCSDVTESDASLSETTLNDTDGRELIKKVDKPKTDLDLDIENNLQISTIAKVPSPNIESKLTDKQSMEPSSITEKSKRKLSLKRSTSLDSDNNNSNRIKLETLNSSDIKDKLVKSDNDTIFNDRSSILTSMSKTFNSKEVSKNIRKARRGRKAATTVRPPQTAKNCISSTITNNDLTEDKVETIDTLSKEISDLINDLDQNIDKDEAATDSSVVENVCDQTQTKQAQKLYGLSKPPLGDNNSIATPDTPVKGRESVIIIAEVTPIKNDDSENIRLHYEEDSAEKIDISKPEVTYKCTTVASIDKLMDRLKEFEEFDKRRQRQESESKPNDGKSLMVTNDVVLIPKSGDIKPLKDVQTARSPERPVEKGNVLSCFENNSAISLLKRDQVRRSIDKDTTNSVTLIKRNSVNARKESTSSNHSREADAISLFEKSLGKDVTLTEIRKSVDKSAAAPQIDLHQLAILHPNNPAQSLVGVVIDSSQISITPRVMEAKIISNDVQLTKRKSTEVNTRKMSEPTTEVDEKMATIEKIKVSVQQPKSPAISITPAPVAIKSAEATQPVEAEVLAPPLENIKSIPDDMSLTSEIPKVDSTIVSKSETSNVAPEKQNEVAIVKMDVDEVKNLKEEKIMEVGNKVIPKKLEEWTSEVTETVPAVVEVTKSARGTNKGNKSARNSLESQAGPSTVLFETPESQKRKESVLRTLGLLTHKEAKEAEIEQQKEKERIYNNMISKKAGKSGSGDYTGTLKTVIKLNRTSGERERKKYRTSLKMTFQKSKNRSGKPTQELGEAEGEEYYTIERREGGAGATSDETEIAPEPVEPSKDTVNLVIPEKASSFGIHPGRLCKDQCCYCGGKFGLFDTPCHIASIKSVERQKKVLDNEEKLTIDSCLCDACYRHVDRRANCPSYRKRVVRTESMVDVKLVDSSPLENSQADRCRSPPGEEGESGSESPEGSGAGRGGTCHAQGCAAAADHAIRRKWLIKVRSSVNKVLKLEYDYPGMHTIPLCGEHYRALAPLMACVLCRRRVTKHHNVHVINQGYQELNPLLSAAQVPVVFAARPVLCKPCRHYCAALQRDALHPNTQHYTRKLLRIYNIEVPEESENERDEYTLNQEDNSSSKQKKKARNKSKQRKSTEPEKSGESECDRTESPQDKVYKTDDKEIEQKQSQPIEEDIESLISSNKIPVPGAAKSQEVMQSDGSEAETMLEMESLLPLDKQTQLQYLLQKQNNPAQFIQKIPNLTQKPKSVKTQNIIGIQKPGLQHRIQDKNARRLHRLGQIMTQPKRKENEFDMLDPEKMKESGISILKNIPLNDECTIESIPAKKQADINTLKNKWQMSESFTQVKRNLSELSKGKDLKKPIDIKYSNPVKRLETNPSISVRELFPGEEEMNLQCNVEFNNVQGVTPAGWEKCSTTIQYDVETKRMWTELQRPYGNQSSFLRHLILLEKYFRSGDLVLSHNATPHAANYSDSVQSRLRAYDNVVNDTPRRSEPAISLIEYRKKPMNGKSLLKTSHNSEEKSKKSMPPPGMFLKPKGKSDKKKPLPPELIAINTPNAQGRKSIQNVLHNIQQLVKGVSASDPTEVAAAPLPPPKYEPPKERKEVPKLDTPKKKKTTSKPWRPTLMPINADNIAKIRREPHQMAVDGRLLPSLVKVMSSNEPYYITREDYNKMCVMRREKLQQLQDGEKQKLSTETETIVTEIQPSAILGSVTSETLDKKELEINQIGSNAATILKNVGLKNITIAPIPPKTATVTSQTVSPVVTSSALLVTSTPIKVPQLTAVSISESMPITSTPMMMPKIPKSLTVIPQTVGTIPQTMGLIPQNSVNPVVEQRP